MGDHLDKTAVRDERGHPRVVYHGTSRDFTDFSPDAQEEALFGRAFYFTEDHDVARSYAEVRHIPPFQGFDDRRGLDAFLADHPDWDAVFVDELPDGRLVAQFRNPEHRPQVIHAHLAIERPLDLDQPPSAELLAKVRAQLDGLPAEDPTTATELYNALTVALAASAADEDAAALQAHRLIQSAGYDGLTQVDRRYENHHRVWIAFSKDQLVEREREVL